MRISLIAAADEQNIIGKGLELPWDLPNDVQFFENTTRGHHVIMGRLSFLALKEKPLSERTNIVLSRNANYQAQGVMVVSSLNDALQIAQQNQEKEVFIIGGENVYKLGLEVAHRIYLTRIHHFFDGDVFFPRFNKTFWKLEYCQRVEPNLENPYAHTFLTYTRRFI